jgi:hypothetical protein
MLLALVRVRLIWRKPTCFLFDDFVFISFYQFVWRISVSVTQMVSTKALNLGTAKGSVGHVPLYR